MILAVHIKAFVKSSKLGIGLLAHQHEHAGYPIRLRRGCAPRKAVTEQFRGGNESAMRLWCRHAGFDYAGRKQARAFQGPGQQYLQWATV